MDQEIYFVSGTTMDGGDVEEEFSGESSSARERACIRAQGIEEDGGSAYVTNSEDDVIDHWEGYQICITPEGQLGFGHNLLGEVA